MSCILYVCRKCGYAWSNDLPPIENEYCPQCDSDEIWIEFDEEGDHNE